MFILKLRRLDIAVSRRGPPRYTFASRMISSLKQRTTQTVDTSLGTKFSNDMHSQNPQDLLNSLIRNDIPAGEYLDFPKLESGAQYKLSKHFYVEQLAKGIRVGLHDLVDHATFFKLFKSYSQKHGLDMRLCLRQAKGNLWILTARKSSDPKPEIILASDFREYGRYKRYTHQLNAGETLLVNSKKDALKARRAWMIYTPKDKRRDMDTIIKKKAQVFQITLGKVSPI